MRIRFILYVLLCPLWLSAQHTETAMDSLERLFKTFEYEQVISNARRLMQNEDVFTSQQKIEILRMKAIAHYTLNDEELASYTFMDILHINPEFILDPVRNSPKIIDFFEKIRANYSPPQKQTELDTKHEPVSKSVQIQTYSRQGALLRSLALPGWGHHYSGRDARGYYLGSAAIASLVTAVYFTWQTARFEKDYLNATEHSQIQSRYDKYNRSYQFRNAALAVYGAIWLYAQIDLFTIRSADSGYMAQISPAVALNKQPALKLTIFF